MALPTYLLVCCRLNRRISSRRRNRLRLSQTLSGLLKVILIIAVQPVMSLMDVMSLGLLS